MHEFKGFNLDLRALSNRTWAGILNEANKCELVCSNCHKEIHNPGLPPNLRRQGAERRRVRQNFHLGKFTKTNVTGINDPCFSVT